MPAQPSAGTACHFNDRFAAIWIRHLINLVLDSALDLMGLERRKLIGADKMARCRRVRKQRVGVF
jgi:hypothetical protein